MNSSSLLGSSGGGGGDVLYMPISGINACISLPLDSLPEDGKFNFGAGREYQLSELLGSEMADPELWLSLALAYFHRDQLSIFETLLRDFTGEEAQLAYGADDSFKSGRIAAFNTLAAYETRKGCLARNKQEQEEAFNAATDLYNKSADLDPAATLTWVGKGLLLLVRGQLDDALSAFKSAALSDHFKESALARLGMGAALMHKKMYKEAVKEYKMALQINPALPAYCRLGFGICYYYLGDKPQARRAFERVQALSAESGDGENVHALLGLATLELNEWRERVQSIELESRKLDGTAAQASMTQSRLKSLEADECVRRGLELARRAYEVDPTNVHALLLLSNHHFHTGDLKRSRELASRALEVCDASPHLSTHEGRAHALYHVARTHHVLGEYEQAFMRYEQAKEVLPENAAICLGYAQMLLAWKGETEKAIDTLEHILSVAPTAKANASQAELKKVAEGVANNFHVLRLLGSLYAMPPSKSALHAKAVAAASAGLKDRESKKEKRAAKELVTLPDYDKAYTYLDRSVNLHPNDLDLLLQFAEVAARLHIYKQSLLSYQRCLKLMLDLHKMSKEQVEPALLHNMAVVCHKMKKHQEAREYYAWSLKNRQIKEKGEEAGVDMEVDDAFSSSSSSLLTSSTAPIPADHLTTHYNFALLLDAQGDVSGALKKLESISTQYPHYLDAILYRATIHQRSGDMQRAKEMLLQAAEAYKEQEAKLGPHAPLQCMWGNWYLEQRDVDAAGKCFDTLLTQFKASAAASHGVGAKRDDYAKVAIGNITLLKAHRKMRAMLLANPQLAALLAAQTSVGAGGAGAAGAAMVAAAHMPPALEARLKDHRDKFKEAAAFYENVLMKDVKNVYAAHGLACVLAEQGKLVEAKEIFQQVKDITASGMAAANSSTSSKHTARVELDLVDVWCNLGHIYVSQGSYVSAIKMYEHCLKNVKSSTGTGTAAAGGANGEEQTPAQKLTTSASSVVAPTRNLHTVQILTFLARAYYLSDALQDAKRTLMKALQLAPNATPLWYNLALTSEAYAIDVFQKAPAQRTFREVESALSELKHAQSIFERLAGEKQALILARGSMTPAQKAEVGAFGDIVDKASKHAIFCRFSLEHGQPHLEFAKQREEEQARLLEESRATRAKLEEERAAKEAEELRRKEEERIRLEEEAAAKKKHLQSISESWKTVISEETRKKDRAAAQANMGGGSDGEYAGGSIDAEAEVARRREKGKQRTQKRSKRERDSGSDGDTDNERDRDRERERKKRKKEKEKKKKGRSKYQEASDDDAMPPGHEAFRRAAADSDGEAEADSSVKIDVDAELAARRAKAAHLTGLTQEQDASEPTVKVERKGRLTKAAADTDDDEETPAYGEAKEESTDAMEVQPEASMGGAGEEEAEEEEGAGMQQSRKKNKKRRQIAEDSDEEAEAFTATQVADTAMDEEE